MAEGNGTPDSPGPQCPVVLQSRLSAPQRLASRSVQALHVSRRRYAQGNQCPRASCRVPSEPGTGCVQGTGRQPPCQPSDPPPSLWPTRSAGLCGLRIRRAIVPIRAWPLHGPRALSRIWLSEQPSDVPVLVLFWGHAPSGPPDAQSSGQKRVRVCLLWEVRKRKETETQL